MIKPKEGVVIKIEGHLNGCAVYNYPNGPCDCQDRKQAGCTVVAPLIELPDTGFQDCSNPKWAAMQNVTFILDSFKPVGDK